MFNEFFELSPVNYAKHLNLKNTEENKKLVTEGKNRISALKNRMKKMSKTEKKKKNANETLKIIEEILDYNKNAPILFLLALEVDKKSDWIKYCRQKKIKERKEC